MTAPVLTKPPSSHIAGDSLAFVWSHVDYPKSAGWSAALTFVGATVPTAIVGTTDSSDADAFDFAVSAAVSAAMATTTASTYRWFLRVTLSTTTTTAESGVTVFTPNPATATAGSFSSWEETTLPIVEAALTGTLTAGQRRYMIGGRQMEDIPPKELMDIRAGLLTAIAQQRGQPFGTPVVYRFRSAVVRNVA